MKHSKTYNEIVDAMQALSTKEKREILPRFFKTGRGEYGEGDCFMGVTVPDTRSVARQYVDVSYELLKELLADSRHEIRLLALLVMVARSRESYRQSWLRKHGEAAAETLREELFTFYLQHTTCVNNWDLVDLSAPDIVGNYLLHRDKTILYQLADSHNLWEQRIAIVSTYAMIRQGDVSTTMSLATRLVNHSHDLMHKAVGWMLREAGKKDIHSLRAFLCVHAATMPRTMLRYAIERMTVEERQEWMQKKKQR